MEPPGDRCGQRTCFGQASRTARRHVHSLGAASFAASAPHPPLCRLRRCNIRGPFEIGWIQSPPVAARKRAVTIVKFEISSDRGSRFIEPKLVDPAKVAARAELFAAGLEGHAARELADPAWPRAVADILRDRAAQNMDITAAPVGAMHG
jgi:hypothetical protein